MMADKQQQKPLSAVYAVPCEEGATGDLFFVTFTTRDEREALRLASCVQGNLGRKALVAITEDGDIFHID